MLLVLFSSLLTLLELVHGLPHVGRVKEDGRGTTGGKVAQTKDALVDLGYSSYQGTVLGGPGGVNQYLGMRFAAAPLGDLRWRAPQEPAVTSDVVDAISVCAPNLRWWFCALAFCNSFVVWMYR